MTTVYQLDQNGYYVGKLEAQPDPLNPENLLIPGGCILEAPPETDTLHRPRYLNGAWAAEALPQPPAEAPANPVDLNKSAARAALGLSDVTMARIVEGVIRGTTSFNAPDILVWAQYRAALRSCVSNGTPIPERPAYPSGT